VGVLVNLLVWALITLSPCVINYWLAERKSRNPVLWAILGFPFTFLSSILLLFLPPGGYGVPTLEEYLQKHPNCETGSGIKCANCGSKSIRSLGVTGANDARRRHSCNHCGVVLYKTRF
jgi:DNA-directed RNA polymerase subunit RPC12/RpoP